MFLIKKCICPCTNITFGGAIIIQAASKAQFPRSQQQADLAILPGDGARRQATVRDGARCATVRDGAVRDGARYHTVAQGKQAISDMATSEVARVEASAALCAATLQSSDIATGRSQ